MIESEITTLSAAAYKVIRVGGSELSLVNIERQSSHETELTRTLWFRQVALDYRHNLPVLTVLVLLRKEANSPNLTGEYERYLPDGRLMNRYEYQVVQLWKESAESFLNAEVELVPLAPLGDVDEQQSPELVRKMANRSNTLPAPCAAKLWTALYLLMGLRYPDELILELLDGVQAVKESTTYQKILRDGRVEGRVEGRTEEAQRFLLRLGTKRFGPPVGKTLDALEDVQDINRLEDLGERILDADVVDWEGLLGLS